MSRLPEFDLGTLDVAQESIYEGIVSGPRGKFGGPFYALIHAPEIGLKRVERASVRSRLAEFFSLFRALNSHS